MTTLDDLAPFLPKDYPFLIFSALDDPPLDAEDIEQLENALRLFRRERSGAVRSWTRVYQPEKRRHVFVVVLGGAWINEESSVQTERINLGYHVARRVNTHCLRERQILLSRVMAYATPEVKRRLWLNAYDRQERWERQSRRSLTASDETRGV